MYTSQTPPKKKNKKNGVILKHKYKNKTEKQLK